MIDHTAPPGEIVWYIDGAEVGRGLFVEPVGGNIYAVVEKRPGVHALPRRTDCFLSEVEALNTLADRLQTIRDDEHRRASERILALRTRARELEEQERSVTK